MSKLTEWVDSRLTEPIVQRAKSATDTLKAMVVKSEDDVAAVVDYSGSIAHGLTALREIRRKALAPIEQQKREVLDRLDPLIKALDETNKAAKGAVQTYRRQLEAERQRKVREQEEEARRAAAAAAKEAALTDEPAPPMMEHVDQTVAPPADKMVRGGSTVMYESGRWTCELVAWQDADPAHLEIKGRAREAVSDFLRAVRREEIAPRKDAPFKWQGFVFTWKTHEVQRDAGDVRPRDDRPPELQAREANARALRTFERNIERTLEEESTP